MAAFERTVPFVPLDLVVGRILNHCVPPGTLRVPVSAFLPPCFRLPPLNRRLVAFRRSGSPVPLPARVVTFETERRRMTVVIISCVDHPPSKRRYLCITEYISVIHKLTERLCPRRCITQRFVERTNIFFARVPGTTARAYYLSLSIMCKRVCYLLLTTSTFDKHIVQQDV